MRNAKTEVLTRWPCLALHPGARTAEDAAEVIVPIRTVTAGVEPCACRAPRAEATEPVPPSVIERPFYTRDGGEDPELTEYLRPPPLPWERRGAR